jgi:hypothetical protein
MSSDSENVNNNNSWTLSLSSASSANDNITVTRKKSSLTNSTSPLKVAAISKSPTMTSKSPVLAGVTSANEVQVGSPNKRTRKGIPNSASSSGSNVAVVPRRRSLRHFSSSAMSLDSVAASPSLGSKKTMRNSDSEKEIKLVFGKDSLAEEALEEEDGEKGESESDEELSFSKSPRKQQRPSLNARDVGMLRILAKVPEANVSHKDARGRRGAMNLGTLSGSILLQGIGASLAEM